MQDDLHLSHSESTSSILKWIVIWVAIFAFAIGAVWLYARSNQAQRARFEQARLARCQKAFENIQAGGNSALVMDSDLLPMIANDPKCANKLVELYFSMVDIDEKDAEHVSKLKNLKQLGFYCTGGADHVLEHAKGLPIESLYFEMSGPSLKQLQKLPEFPLLREVLIENLLSEDESAFVKQFPPEIEVKYTPPGS